MSRLRNSMLFVCLMMLVIVATALPGYAIPTITSFSPSEGQVGQTVTITGNNFVGSPVVRFNGTWATTSTVNSTTSITAVVPSGASTGPITVKNSYGTGMSTIFIINPRLSPPEFTPTAGKAGDQVTITGVNIKGIPIIRFNGICASSYTVVDSTTLSVVVPVDATTGKISVTTEDGTATSILDFKIYPKPTITSFSEAGGKTGDRITITGINFTGTTAVLINNTPVISFTVSSASTVLATVPVGATSGNISVVTPGGTAVSEKLYTVYIKPTISSFTPTSGKVGQVVTIIGTHFTGATTVSIGGNASFTVESDTTIKATVPIGATTSKISVEAKYPYGMYQNIATSADSFTIIPTIVSITPMSGNIGQSVTITGTNFTGATSVMFNGKAVAFYVWSDTRIVVTIRSGDTSGPVTVSNSGGSDTSQASFTVCPMPTIASFTPISGESGQIVTITGTAFTGVTAVSFHDKPAASFNITSDTSIIAEVPVGATTGPISVSNAYGTAWSASSFTIYPLPTITSFTPTKGRVGDRITISVANVTRDTIVEFNGSLNGNFTGISADFTIDSETSITAIVPNGAISGRIALSNGGITSKYFTVVPAIVSFTPTTGSAGQKVIIQGTGFIKSNTHVAFNGVATGATVDSSTSITALIPDGATTGKISVMNPEGLVATAVSTDIFYVAPTMTAITPWSGRVGSIVNITGKNFSGVTAVVFNSTTAVNFTINSDMSITATVPDGATSGPIYLRYLGGPDTTNYYVHFIVDYPIPTIISFTPNYGKVGSIVKICGVNFTGATSVEFGGAPSKEFHVLSDTLIAATVPSDAVTGAISVSCAGNERTTYGYFCVDPTISCFTPTSGDTGQSITITGTGYTGVEWVDFGGKVATYTVRDATSISAIVPQSAETGHISIITRGGKVTSVTEFVTSQPTITSFTPTCADAGVIFTITGTNFTGATAVTFNNAPSPSMTVVSETSITATVPIDAISGPISVTTPYGTAWSKNDFYATTVTPDEEAIHSVYATMKSAMEAHKLDDVMALFAHDYMNNGTDLAMQQTYLTSIVPVLDKFDYAITKIEVTGAKAIVTCSISISFTDGRPPITFTEPSETNAGFEVANLLKIDNHWLIDGNQKRGRVNVTTLHMWYGTDYVYVTAEGKSLTTATLSGPNTQVTVIPWDAMYNVFSAVIELPISPRIGDIYDFNLTYADGYQETLSDEVTGVATAPKLTADTGNNNTIILKWADGRNITPNAEYYTSWVLGYDYNWISPYLDCSCTSVMVDEDDTATGTLIQGRTYRCLLTIYDIYGNQALESVDITIPTTPLPTITSFLPIVGKVGDVITITGTGFTGTTEVKVNTTAAIFTIDSDTSVTATIPSGATAGCISLTTPGGSALSDTDFTIYEPTSLEVSVDPGAGYLGALDRIALNYRLIGPQLYDGALALNGSGKSLIDGLQPGAYDLSLSGSHWLRRIIKGIDLTTPNSVSASLINGDADGGNSINLFDFVVLDSKFGSSDPMADLNGDGQVNLFDYTIIDQNFGAQGD